MIGFETRESASPRGDFSSYLIPMHTPDFCPETALAARRLVDLALAEDLTPAGDRTSEAVIPEATTATAVFVARSGGVVAGLPVARIASDAFPGLVFHEIVSDGLKVPPRAELAVLSGPLRSILMAERTALNFLQRLSGVATLTSQFVKAVAGTKAVVLDTRKTTPGWRALEKYAVRCGGGTNHRMSLADGILIKDNHLAGLGTGGVSKAVELARADPRNAGLGIEIEVDSLGQLDEALGVKPEIVLLDNMTPDVMREAVKRRNERSPHTKLEASGGINLSTIRAAAETGVDRISVGAITHSAPALDIALDYRP
jgi:nicotinate-nucleotide pyrophosphorylase (carboxylating)